MVTSGLFFFKLRELGVKTCSFLSFLLCFFGVSFSVPPPGFKTVRAGDCLCNADVVDDDNIDVNNDRQDKDNHNKDNHDKNPIKG